MTKNYSISELACLFIVALGIHVAIAPQLNAVQPSDVPTNIPGPQRTAFLQNKAELEKERDNLLKRITAHNHDCPKEMPADSAKVPQCQQEQQKLNNDEAQYLAKVAIFNAEVRQASGQGVQVAPTVSPAIAMLQKQIASDEEAIHRLGFQKRADEFGEWEKFSNDTKRAYEQEVAQILLKLAIDEATAFAAQGGAESVSTWTKRDANRWIETLRKYKFENPTLFEKMREFAAAGNKEARNVLLKSLIAGTSQAAQTAVQARPGALTQPILTAITESFVEAVTTAHSPQMRLLAGEVELTSATVYDSAAQNVSQARIEQLTQMTEEQLKGVQILSRVLRQHVAELKAAKVRL